MRPWHTCAAVWLAVLVGCSHADPAPGLGRLPELGGKVGGERRVLELDASGDGKVDAADWQIFDRVADAAGAVGAPASGYYAGPAEGDVAWRNARAGGAAPDLSQVPASRRRELGIEMHWMGLQARLVAAAGASEGTVGGMLKGAVPGYDTGRMEPASLCKALQTIDISTYGRAGLPPTAVFDVDSTLWAGNGTDVFLAALIQERALLPEANPGIQEFLQTVPGIDKERVRTGSVYDNAKLLLDRSVNERLPAEQRVMPKDSFYQIVGLLRGQTEAPVRAAARVAVEEGALGLPPWKSRVYADHDGCGMVKVVHSLVDRGVMVFLLSATPDVMVVEAGRLFGLPAGQALGSALGMRNGRYTGQVRDNTYYVKGSIVRQWLPAPPLLAFGDSPTSDFAMLAEATGAGFMVNPRPEFEKRDREEADARFVGLTFDATEGEIGKAP